MLGLGMAIFVLVITLSKMAIVSSALKLVVLIMDTQVLKPPHRFVVLVCLSFELLVSKRLNMRPLS